MTKKKGIQIESPARWTDFKFKLPYYGTRYMHFHFINVWIGQEMTISCKAKGRESNDSKNNRMWYRIILLNKFIYFFLYSGIYMYKICFLFKTMTSRFKSSFYILMFTTQPIPPPKKKIHFKQPFMVWQFKVYHQLSFCILI